MLEIISVALTALLSIAGQEIRWRRKQRAKVVQQRVQAYEELLAVSDLCFSALREFANLHYGLGWWNGRSRLAVLKSTKLDDRMRDLSDRIAAAIASVHIYGTPDGVVVAEELLAAMSAPLLEAGSSSEEEFKQLMRSRRAFLDVVRREAGASGLEAA